MNRKAHNPEKRGTSEVTTDPLARARRAAEHIAMTTGLKRALLELRSNNQDRMDAMAVELNEDGGFSLDAEEWRVVCEEAERELDQDQRDYDAHESTKAAKSYEQPYEPYVPEIGDDRIDPLYHARERMRTLIEVEGLDRALLELRSNNQDRMDAMALELNENGKFSLDAEEWRVVCEEAQKEWNQKQAEYEAYEDRKDNTRLAA